MAALQRPQTPDRLDDPKPRGMVARPAAPPTAAATLPPSPSSIATKFAKTLAELAQKRIGLYAPGTLVLDDEVALPKTMRTILSDALLHWPEIYDVPGTNTGAMIRHCLNTPHDDVFALHAGMRSEFDIMPENFPQEFQILVKENDDPSSRIEVYKSYIDRIRRKAASSPQRPRSVLPVATALPISVPLRTSEPISTEPNKGEKRKGRGEEPAAKRPRPDVDIVPRGESETPEKEIKLVPAIMTTSTVTNIVVPCGLGDGPSGGFFGEQSTCLIYRLCAIDPQALDEIFAPKLGQTTGVKYVLPEFISSQRHDVLDELKEYLRRRDVQTFTGKIVRSTRFMVVKGRANALDIPLTRDGLVITAGNSLQRGNSMFLVEVIYIDTRGCGPALLTPSSVARMLHRSCSSADKRAMLQSWIRQQRERKQKTDTDTAARNPETADVGLINARSVVIDPRSTVDASELSRALKSSPRPPDQWLMNELSNDPERQASVTTVTLLLDEAVQNAILMALQTDMQLSSAVVPGLDTPFPRFFYGPMTSGSSIGMTSPGEFAEVSEIRYSHPATPTNQSIAGGMSPTMLFQQVTMTFPKNTSVISVIPVLTLPGVQTDFLTQSFLDLPLIPVNTTSDTAHVFRVFPDDIRTVATVVDGQMTKYTITLVIGGVCNIYDSNAIPSASLNNDTFVRVSGFRLVFDVYQQAGPDVQLFVLLPNTTVSVITTEPMLSPRGPSLLLKQLDIPKGTVVKRRGVPGQYEKINLSDIIGTDMSDIRAVADAAATCHRNATSYLLLTLLNEGLIEVGTTLATQAVQRGLSAACFSDVATPAGGEHATRILVSMLGPLVTDILPINPPTAETQFPQMILEQKRRVVVPPAMFLSPTRYPYCAIAVWVDTHPNDKAYTGFLKDVLKLPLETTYVLRPKGEHATIVSARGFASTLIESKRTLQIYSICILNPLSEWRTAIGPLPSVEAVRTKSIVTKYVNSLAANATTRWVIADPTSNCSDGMIIQMLVTIFEEVEDAILNGEPVNVPSVDTDKDTMTIDSFRVYLDYMLRLLWEGIHGPITPKDLQTLLVICMQPANPELNIMVQQLAILDILFMMPIAMVKLLCSIAGAPPSLLQMIEHVRTAVIKQLIPSVEQPHWLEARKTTFLSKDEQTYATLWRQFGSLGRPFDFPTPFFRVPLQRPVPNRIQDKMRKVLLVQITDAARVNDNLQAAVIRFQSAADEIYADRDRQLSSALSPEIVLGQRKITLAADVELLYRQALTLWRKEPRTVSALAESVSMEVGRRIGSKIQSLYQWQQVVENLGLSNELLVVFLHRLQRPQIENRELLADVRLLLSNSSVAPLSVRDRTEAQTRLRNELDVFTAIPALIREARSREIPLGITKRLMATFDPFHPEKTLQRQDFEKHEENGIRQELRDSFVNLSTELQSLDSRQVILENEVEFKYSMLALLVQLFGEDLPPLLSGEVIVKPETYLWAIMREIILKSPVTFALRELAANRQLEMVLELILSYDTSNVAKYDRSDKARSARAAETKKQTLQHIKDARSTVWEITTNDPWVDVHPFWTVYNNILYEKSVVLLNKIDDRRLDLNELAAEFEVLNTFLTVNSEAVGLCRDIYGIGRLNCSPMQNGQSTGDTIRRMARDGSLLLGRLCSNAWQVIVSPVSIFMCEVFGATVDPFRGTQLLRRQKYPSLRLYIESTGIPMSFAPDQQEDLEEEKAREAADIAQQSTEMAFETLLGAVGLFAPPLPPPQPGVPFSPPPSSPFFELAPLSPFSGIPQSEFVHARQFDIGRGLAEQAAAFRRTYGTTSPGILYSPGNVEESMLPIAPEFLSPGSIPRSPSSPQRNLTTPHTVEDVLNAELPNQYGSIFDMQYDPLTGSFSSSKMTASCPDKALHSSYVLVDNEFGCANVSNDESNENVEFVDDFSVEIK